MNILKNYKFTLISIILLIVTCFIGNVGHMILAMISAILIFCGEIFCNRTLKNFEQMCNKQVAAAKKEAAEMLAAYTKCDCHSNGTCKDTCQCHNKEKEEE